MRVIRLTHGPGNGVDRACLMTASNMLIGRPEDGTYNSCVCPVLRAFIIKTNDAMPEDLLGELYGPLVWEILGTRTEDLDTMRRRAFSFADWAVRRVVPMALRRIGQETEAARLEGLDEIVDSDTAASARAAAHAASLASAEAARETARATASAAAYAAARAAASAAACAAACAAEEVWLLCPDIIREAAAIGDLRPVEVAITPEELAAKLGG